MQKVRCLEFEFNNNDVKVTGECQAQARIIIVCTRVNIHAAYVHVTYHTLALLYSSKYNVFGLSQVSVQDDRWERTKDTTDT